MTLPLDPDDFRRAGQRIIDMLVDRMSKPADAVGRVADAEQLSFLDAAAPHQGVALHAALDELLAAAAAASLQVDHPRFFAFVPGPSSPVSALGELIASGWNLWGARPAPGCSRRRAW
jgi:glutamate/tyrosine decarboxylase-like PLP-dependent enzyme